MGFILYFRLWGHGLWPGTPRGGGNSGWVNTGACQLARLAKFQVILEVGRATYHKRILKKPQQRDLWEIPPWPQLWQAVSLWGAPSSVFTVSDEHIALRAQWKTGAGTCAFSKSDPFGAGKTYFSSNIWKLYIHTVHCRQLWKSLPQRTCCLNLLL